MPIVKTRKEYGHVVYRHGYAFRASEEITRENNGVVT